MAFIGSGFFFARNSTTIPQPHGLEVAVAWGRGARTDSRALSGNSRRAYNRVDKPPLHPRTTLTQLRHALSDEHYAIIEPLLPTNDRPGHPWKDHRPVIDGILWVLHTGAPGATCPARLRPLADRLRAVQPLEQGRHLGPAPGGAARPARRGRQDRLGPVLHRRQLDPGRPGRRRGLADRRHGRRAGRPRPGPLPRRVRLEDPPGLRRQGAADGRDGHRRAAARVDAVRGGDGRGPGPRRRWAGRDAGPRKLAGDKGYSYPRIRRYLRRRGIKAVIPTRKDQRRIPTLRQGDVPAPQRGRAVHRLAEGSASAGDAVREAGRELPGDGQAGDARTIAEGTIARHGLVPEPDLWHRKPRPCRQIPGVLSRIGEVSP